MLLLVVHYKVAIVVPLIVADVVERTGLLVEILRRSVIIDILLLLVMVVVVGVPVRNRLPCRRRHKILLPLRHVNVMLVMLAADDVFLVAAHQLVGGKLSCNAARLVGFVDLLEGRGTMHSRYLRRDQAVTLALDAVSRQEWYGVGRVDFADDLVDGQLVVALLSRQRRINLPLHDCMTLLVGAARARVRLGLEASCRCLIASDRVTIEHARADSVITRVHLQLTVGVAPVLFAVDTGQLYLDGIHRLAHLQHLH